MYDDDNSDTNWRTSETWPNHLNTFSQSKISSKKRQTFLGTGTRSCKPVRMISSLLNMSIEETNSCADTAKNSFLPLVQDMSPEKSKDNQESILTWLRQPQVTPSLVPNTGARVVDVAQGGSLTLVPNTGARVVDVAQGGSLTLVPNTGAKAVDVAQGGSLTLVPNTGAKVVDVAQDVGLTNTPNTGTKVVDVAQGGGLTFVPNTGVKVVDVAQGGSLTLVPNTEARVVDVAQDVGLTLVSNTGARVVDVAQDVGLTNTPNTGTKVVDVAQGGGLTFVPNTGVKVVDVAQDVGLTLFPNTGARVVDVAQDVGLTLVPNTGPKVVDVAQGGGLTLVPNTGAKVVDVAQGGGLTLVPNTGARVVNVAQGGSLTLVPNTGAKVVDVAQDVGLTLVSNTGARVVNVAQGGSLTLVPNTGAKAVDVAQDVSLSDTPNTGARVVDVAQDVGLTDTPNTGARAAPLYIVAPRLLSRQASDITDDCCQPKKPLHNSYVTPMKRSHNTSTTQSLLCGGKTALQDLTNNLPFSKSMPTMVSGQNSQDKRPTRCYQHSDNKENEINTTVMRMSESTPLKNCQYVSEVNSMSALKDQFQLKVYNKSSHFRLPLGTHMPRSVNSGPTGAVMEPIVSSDVLNKDLRVPFRVAEPGPTRGIVNTMSVIQEVYCVKQQTITGSPILSATLRSCTKDVGVQSSAQTADAVTMTDTPLDKDKDVLCVNGRRYTTLNKLGLGGSCVVYQVRDHESSSVLAVKCVSLPVHDKMLAQGYLNEVSMIRRLQGSECVIKLIDSEHIPEKNLLYVVMELGETDFSQLIRDTFRTRGKLSLTMILFYWTEMLTAVKYIHDNEVIHSDLKPSNFLVVKGRLKLIDFGISSSVQCDATSVLKDQAMGTINYMSPEAIVDTQDFSSRAQYRISYRSDVWSLGCILYYMIYGRTPFQHIRQPYAKVAAITDPNSQVQYPPAPRLLTNVVQSCLAFDPKKRPTVANLLSVPFFTWEDSAPSEAPTKDPPRN